jgi:hypothetical protein
MQSSFDGRDVRRVVDVSGISRAAAFEHEARISELPKVVGDQVLLFTHQLDQFADSMVAAGEVLNQPPTQIVSEDLERVIRAELARTPHGRTISTRIR